MRTHCGNCDSLLKRTGANGQWQYCPSCVARRSRERRQQEKAIPLAPVLVTGAKARLRAYLDENGDDAIMRVLDFVTRQSYTRSAA